MKSIFSTIILILTFINLSAQDYKINFLSDSTRILYTGYDNTILVPEGTKLTVADPLNSCLLAKINGTTFSAKPSPTRSGKEIKLSLVHKGKTISRTFKVKPMPRPSVFIGSINIETTKSATKPNFLTSAANGVRISYAPEDMLKVVFKITRYHIIIKIAGIPVLEETIEGPKFSEKIMKLFKDKKEYKVEISEIFSQGPSGTIRSTGNYSIDVK
jgi:hypothetical protein